MILRRHIEWTQDKIDFIVEQYTTKKMNTYELAEYLNCSHDTISNRLKEQGIQPRKFYEDLTGRTFGYLYIIKKSDKSGRKLYWDCQCICGKYVTEVGDHLRQGHVTSCGCLKSKGEQKVFNILKSNNINFITQYTFENLISEYNNLKYKFDFAILDNNNNLKYLIEYDGEQHFEKFVRESGWCNRENFMKTQYHDEIKNQYCEQNQIPLIRIPYTQLSKLTLNDLLLETTQFRKV